MSQATDKPGTDKPVIVLVRPQLGENIGKTARAMLNFGLTDLRLVAPRDGWPNPDAGPSASGADIVLEQTQVFDDLAQAVSDCSHVYATTVRKRGLTKPVFSPAQAAAAMSDSIGRSAIVFGPERSGLETDDVALADTILTIPINPDFGSLNLAQAVLVCAYEWSQHHSSAMEQPTHDMGIQPPAPQLELEGLITEMQTQLDARGYFFPADRTPATKRNLRTILSRAKWTSDQIRTLRGVIGHLIRPVREAPVDQQHESTSPERQRDNG